MILVPHWLSVTDQVKRVTSPQRSAILPLANFTLCSKTSSANGPHLNVWGFDISAAEFPQHKIRSGLSAVGLNSPLGPIHTKDARFFCFGNSAADISNYNTFK